ncbi:hypothetical protein ACG7TL_009019 [Trametes sanguinea]
MSVGNNPSIDIHRTHPSVSPIDVQLDTSHRAALDRQSSTPSRTSQSLPNDPDSDAPSGVIGGDSEGEDEEFTPEDSEYLPDEIKLKAKQELKRICVLCGSTKGIIHRVILHHEDWLYPDPRGWLQGLGLNSLPINTMRDEMCNLMIVCEDHATAYDLNVWCFMPSAAARAEMSQLQTLQGFKLGEESIAKSALAKAAIAADGTIEHARKQDLFDLLVFLPQDMPPIDILASPDSQTVAVHKEDIEAGLCPRVLKSFRKLHCDRYMVFAHALEMLNAAYLPLPDEDLRIVEEECLAIRNGWNRAFLQTRTFTLFPEYRADFNGKAK